MTTKVSTPYEWNRGPRVPFLIYTENTRDDPIKFWINPSESSWTISYRTAIEPIQGGVVHHEWYSTGFAEQDSSKIKQTILNLSFQSGNIIPYGYMDYSFIEDNEDVPPGLANFYDFTELLNEKDNLENGTPNYVNIVYEGPAFKIHLKGFFSAEGVQWTDSAESPSMINNWGATFVVFKSSPALTDAMELREAFRMFRVQVDEEEETPVAVDTTIPENPVWPEPLFPVGPEPFGPVQQEPEPAPVKEIPPYITLPDSGDIAEGAEQTRKQMEDYMKDTMDDPNIKVNTTRAEEDANGNRYASWDITNPGTDDKTNTVNYSKTPGLKSDDLMDVPPINNVTYKEGLVGVDDSDFDGASKDCSQIMESKSKNKNVTDHLKKIGVLEP